MNTNISNEQRERVARRMGYNGPMHKFPEFLMSTPKRKYNQGGLVDNWGNALNQATSAGSNTEEEGLPPTTPFDPTVRPEGSPWPEHRAQKFTNTINQGQYNPASFYTRQDADGGFGLYSGDQQVLRFGNQNVMNDFIQQYSNAWAQREGAKTEQDLWRDMVEGYQWDPGSITSPEVDVSLMEGEQDQLIPEDSGQVGAAPDVDVQEGEAEEAATPQDISTAIVEAVKNGENIEELLEQYRFATGVVEDDSTVRGQLEKLMQDFNEGKAPPWASGAIRNANTIMAQRGISSSSMAGQAVLQAAMEAALPIAQADAQTHFAMQMQNLSNEQQMLVQKNDARLESFFTDTATENATRQFNAANENQTRQFNEQLRAQVNQFNAAQRNAMEEFNVGQVNAVSMFKAQMQDQRDQFNAGNRLIIDQANARWRQQIATQNNATINEANRTNAANLLATTLAEYNNISQARRDAMNFAFNASENAKERAVNLLLAQMRSDEATAARNEKRNDGLFSALGGLAARMFDGIFS